MDWSDDDVRLILSQAQSAIASQSNQLDRLRSNAFNAISATGVFLGLFLGVGDPSSYRRCVLWLALGSFAVSLGLAIAVVKTHKGWNFNQSAAALIKWVEYERDTRSGGAESESESKADPLNLSLYVATELEKQQDKNSHLMTRLQGFYDWSLIFLAVATVLLSIAALV